MSKSTQEIKESFRRKGVSVSSWSRNKGFNRSTVYAVLNNQVKCYYGQSHKIAVALGIKTES